MPSDRRHAWINQGGAMNQQIQKSQASALDRAKVALAHGAHAIDSSDVSELIQELGC